MWVTKALASDFNWTHEAQSQQSFSLCSCCPLLSVHLPHVTMGTIVTWGKCTKDFERENELKPLTSFQKTGGLHWAGLVSLYFKSPLMKLGKELTTLQNLQYFLKLQIDSIYKHYKNKTQI